jgi:hypothetical protein
VISTRTPVKFSWSFFLRDNVRRIFFNLILIVVAIRFTTELTGKAINEWHSFLIGLSSDGIAWALNHFRLWKLSGTAVQKNPPPDLAAEIREELGRKERNQ